MEARMNPGSKTSFAKFQTERCKALGREISFTFTFTNNLFKLNWKRIIKLRTYVGATYCWHMLNLLVRFITYISFSFCCIFLNVFVAYAWQYHSNTRKKKKKKKICRRMFKWGIICFDICNVPGALIYTSHLFLPGYVRTYMFLL